MKTLDELNAIRDKMKGQVGFRFVDETQIRVVVGMDACGIAAGAKPVLCALADAIQQRNLTNIRVTPMGCIGLCQYEPIIEVIKPGEEKVTYVHMTAEKAMTVLEQHLIHGQIVTEYTINESLH